MVCNSGVGLTPYINKRLYHFSAGGLYNGLVLLIDDETRTYWDHITGEALHGPMRNARMPVWGVHLTTVRQALSNEPDLLLLRSRQSLLARLLSWFMSRPFARKTIPPGFRKTMGPRDHRLPEMEIGLGVISRDIQRFYPKARIEEDFEDNWQGHALRIRINSGDGIPYAEFTDGRRPLQLFTRWYGFSYTFPGCQIYRLDDTHSVSKVINRVSHSR